MDDLFSELKKKKKQIFNTGYEILAIYNVLFSAADYRVCIDYNTYTFE